MNSHSLKIKKLKNLISEELEKGGGKLFIFFFCLMLLLIVFAVMFMGIALLLAMYSSFLPFMYSYGNTMQYTAAYYGALSAIERGVLAATSAGPGFDGDSGWKNSTNTGANVDHRFSNFYTYGNGNDSLYRKVSSSTTSIPRTGEGNVSPDFRTGNNSSKNYNTLEYNTAEIIPLGTIQELGSNAYYKKDPKNVYTTPDFNLITVDLRINPALRSGFMLNSTNPNIRQLNKELFNKAVANWTIKGRKNGEPFTILPYEARGARGILADDTQLRGSHFSNDAGLTQMTFGQNQGVFEGEGKLNLITANETNLQNEPYTKLLKGTQGTHLTLDLVNLLKIQGNLKTSAIYPFLEYKVSIAGNNAKIADRFYKIQGEGKVGSYNVKMQVQKPTIAQPALGNFTIIF